MKAAGYTVKPLELDWTGLLLLDRAGTMNPALKDVQVRQAINYAFDTKALLKAVGKGYGTPTTPDLPEELGRVRHGAGLAGTPTTRPRPRSCSPRPATPTGSTLSMPQHPARRRRVCSP